MFAATSCYDNTLIFSLVISGNKPTHNLWWDIFTHHDGDQDMCLSVGHMAGRLAKEIGLKKSGKWATTLINRC